MPQPWRNDLKNANFSVLLGLNWSKVWSSLDNLPNKNPGLSLRLLTLMEMVIYYTKEVPN